MNTVDKLTQRMNKMTKAQMGAKTCTQIAKSAKQPRGGYINPMTMICEDLADDEYRRVLIDGMKEENLAANVVGVVVDYLLRYSYEAPEFKGEAVDMACLSIPRHGVRDSYGLDMEEFTRQASRLNGDGLDDESIDAMCVLTAWDTMYRSGLSVDLESLHPDAITTEHIRMMVLKAREMMGDGPIVFGPTFEGGMPMKVHSADADYIRGRWLVDMKVSKKEIPDKVQTLQLAIYFIMGKLTIGSGINPNEDAFNSMEGIEILNPRCGVRWRLLMDNVPEDVLEAILNDVMGGFDPAYA